MKQIDDIYILLEEYNENTLSSFIESYLNKMKCQSEILEYPQYFGDSIFETNSYKEMINYVTGNRFSYDFYFESEIKDNDLKFGVIFFNDDQSLIIGVSTESSKSRFYLNKMKKDFSANYFLVMNEILPPKNSKDFKTLSKINLCF